MVIEIKPVIELPEISVKYIAERLREQWESCGPNSYVDFRESLENAGDYIVAAVNGSHKDTQNYLGVLRSIPLDYEGDPNWGPIDYFALTENGTWRNHKSHLPPSQRDIMLVDFMGFYEGAGISDIFIPYARERFQACRSLSTFSPPTAVRLHKKRGAKPVRILPNGRPGYKMPLVIVNNYWAPVDLEEISEETIKKYLRQFPTV